MGENSIDKKPVSHAEGLAYIQAQTARTGSICEASRSSILELIIKHAGICRTPYTGKYLALLSRQIQEEYSTLKAKLCDEMEHSVPWLAASYYFMALKDIGVSGNTSVSGSIDPERMNYLVESANNDIGVAIMQMQNSEIRHLRNISAKVFRETSLTGSNRTEVSQRMLNEATSLPGFSFIDKAGRKWDTKSYFDMLGRTVLLNTGRSSYLDACAGNGSDIVRVTVSAHPCPYCAVWENRLLSISGKTPGLPTVDEAIDNGLFHPNCNHAQEAIPPAMAARDYNESGRANSGVNSPGNEAENTPEAWKQYRAARPGATRTTAGPLAEILGVKKVNLDSIHPRWRASIEDHLATLYKTYDSKLKSIRMGNLSEIKGSVTPDGTQMRLGKNIFSDRKDYIDYLREEIATSKKVRIDNDKMSLYTVTHEFGHTIFTTNFSSGEHIAEMQRIWLKYFKSFIKVSPEKYAAIFLSYYAEKDLNEFFTEGFTQYILSSKPTLTAQEIGAFVEKYLRRK